MERLSGRGAGVRSFALGASAPTRATPRGWFAAIYLRRLGIRITIARRSNEHRGGAFDREIYRTRNLVERLINRLKHFRRVATRYEKRAENYEAMLKLAAIKIWLWFANRP
jgi:transposase